jgi:glycosyltransferase involved in cell wall biosynthesis
MFVHTVMPVGGAETLLCNLIRRLDRRRFAPEVCCLKYPGPLGEVLAKEVPLSSGLLKNKYDLRVLPRLVRLLRKRRIDAVVTVGAGDRMFWGRLAAKMARVPVILTALHSTGWPDVVGRLNRLLTRITDGFIAVAEEHGRYLRDVERFPSQKVFVIPNGVDVDRFRPLPKDEKLRRSLGLSAEMLVVGIVAALRPEKDHALFLRVAQRVREMLPETRFLVVGDGVLRGELESMAQELGLSDAVFFLGNRSDVPELLALMDVVVLTSKVEANPVTILEAMAAGKPFVAPAVGSVRESIADGQTGYLALPGDERDLAEKIDCVLRDGALAKAMGKLARQWVVEHGSVEKMVEGYESLLTRLYEQKTGRKLALPAEARSNADAVALSL